MKIGFVIVLAPMGNAPRYEGIRQMAQLAEQRGFDSIWLYDHLLYRYPKLPTIGIWECWSMLAALAQATERVELGTLVVCNSFRNPAILAKMAETVDEISNGRLILGLGAGWNKPEYDAFGMPFGRIRDRFEEAVQIVRPLLREGRTSFHGKYYAVDDCEITPRGPRAGGIPILVGASGPRMMALTARYADMWNTAYMGSAATFEPHLERFRTACKKVGRDPGSVGITALANVWFRELGDGPPPPGDPALDNTHIDKTCLVGGAQEMINELQRYESLGTSHLMFHCWPYTPAALEALGDVVSRYRAERV